MQWRRPGFSSWVGKIPWRRDRLPTPVFLGIPCDSAGKESACNMGDLDWEDPLEKGKATHSSVLAWRIPWTSPYGCRVGRDWVTFTFTFPFCSMIQTSLFLFLHLLFWKLYILFSYLFLLKLTFILNFIIFKMYQSLYFPLKQFWGRGLESFNSVPQPLPTSLLFSCSVVSDSLRPMHYNTPVFPVLH